jgi:malonyl CoA-acyl carrier protein transacylase
MFFPGKGSQSKGMGASVLDVFWKHVEETDESPGHSIRLLSIEDPRGVLVQTEYT